MSSDKSWRVFASVLVVMLGLCSATAHAIEIDAIWIGGGGNNLWSNRSNWDCGCVPCNQDPVEFNVIIPAGVGTVQYDLAVGDCELKRLALGNNSTLAIARGAALTVLEDAELCGIVDASDNFVAEGDTGIPGDGAVFSCNRARVAAQNAAMVVIDAPLYSSTGLWASAAGSTTRNWFLFTATDPGTVLDLSSVLSIDAGFNDNDGSDTNIQHIDAMLGATIDLSGVQTVSAPLQELTDRLQFTLSGGSTIFLDSLDTIQANGAGQTEFIVEADTSLNLPSLQLVDRARFELNGGAIVNVGGSLAQIVDSRWALNGGSMFLENGTGATYSSTGLWASAAGSTTRNWFLFTATDPGTVLDLSSVLSIDAGFNDNDGSDTNIQHIDAMLGATIDLSGVQTLTAPIQEAADKVQISVTGDSLIDMSSLEVIESAGDGTIDIDLDTGGELWLGSWEDVSANISVTLDNADPLDGIAATTLRIGGTLMASGSVTIDLLHANTHLDVDGSLLTGDNIDITAPNGGTVSVGGHFVFTHKVEDELMLADAIVQFDGSGTTLAPQLLEVGGLDFFVFCNSLANDNFGFGQLVLGQDGQPTVVKLQDVVDNGNTGGSNPEALYLFGLGPERCMGAQNSLRLLGGSTLVIPAHINVYAYVLSDELGHSDEIVHFNSLLEVDGAPLEYDQGFIQLVSVFEFPAAGAANRVAVGDLDGDDDTDIIIVIPGDNSVQVFLNLGNDKDGFWQGLEGLVPVVVGPDPSAVAIGLFDADVHLDVVVTNAGDNTITVLFNDGLGTGTFGSSDTFASGDDPSAVAVADFVGRDGFMDLAVANKGDNNIDIFVNDGTGQFVAGKPVSSAGLAPAAIDPSDVGGDRDPDILGVNSGDVPGSIFVSLNSPRGFGMSVIHEIGVAPTDLAVGDLNFDGLPDIVAANGGDGTLSILVNQGGGMFTVGTVLSVGDQPLSVEVVDLDGDGDLDLAVVATPGIPAVQLIFNLGTSPGDLIFGVPVTIGVEADPNFVATADFNDDDLDDLVTVNDDEGKTGGSVTVLLTEPPCPWDIDGNGSVTGINDLLELLANWGPCPEPCPPTCAADFDGDCNVGITDFLALLAHWGPCR